MHLPRISSGDSDPKPLLPPPPSPLSGLHVQEASPNEGSSHRDAHVQTRIKAFPKAYSSYQDEYQPTETIIRDKLRRPRRTHLLLGHKFFSIRSGFAPPRRVRGVTMTFSKISVCTSAVLVYHLRFRAPPALVWVQ